MHKFWFALVIGAVPQSVMATVFLGGTVASYAGVIANGVSDADAQVREAPDADGLVASQAQAVVFIGSQPISSGTTVSARWYSPDAGLVSMRWGWSLLRAEDYVLFADTQVILPNWSYRFRATDNGFFNASYVIRTEGDDRFGLFPLFGAGDVPTGPYGSGNIADPAGSGTFSIPLVRGMNYDVGLFNAGGTGGGPGFSAQALAFANINWSIVYDVVPEPGVWALLIAGFGVVGAEQRRRRAGLSAYADA